MGYSVETSTSSAWVTLGYALAYNLGALLLVGVAYHVGHKWRFWHRMIAPRNACGERQAFVKPLQSLWATVRQVVAATEEEVVQRSGTDAAAYVAHFTMWLQLFIVLVLTVFPVLLIFYQQGANPSGVQGINQLSLSNVLDQSTVMWASLVCLYFVSFAVYYLGWRHTLHVLRLRKQFFLDPRRRTEPHHFAAIVMCIPPPPDYVKEPHSKTITQILSSWWDAVFPPQAPRWPQKPLGQQQKEAKGAAAEAIAALGLGAASQGGKSSPLLASTVSSRAAQGLAAGEAASSHSLASAGRNGSLNGSSSVLPKAASGGRSEEGVPAKGVGGEAGGAEAGLLYEEYLQPGERHCLPHVAGFFRGMFGEHLLHLQPVYCEAAMIPSFRRWRHAIRMLNESRMRWEHTLRQAAEKAQEQVASEAAKAGAEGLEPGSVRQEELTPPRHKINKKLWFFGGEEVESIPYWTAQVEAAAAGLRAAQQWALENPVKSAVVAIFKTRKAAAVCREALQEKRHTSWMAVPSSPVQEMWWDNLRFSPLENRARTFWATVFTVLMVVLFYIPVTMLASLVTGEKLSPVFSDQKEEVTTSWLPPALQAIVPSLALHSVLWIFSPVFMLIGRWEGRPSLSDAMIVSSSRFYYVVVVNVLISYSLSTSLGQAITNVAEGEMTVSELFASSLPANAAFYIQYTLNSSLMCGMELGRLPIHICCFLVKVFCFGTSNCDRERHWDQGPMAYHVFVAYANLILTYGVVYSIVAPLILPFSLLYTVIAYFTWKHELLHTYRDPTDRGGVYWVRLIHHLLNALLIGQVTTVGMLGTKHAYTQMGLAVPSIFLTFATYLMFSVHYDQAFKGEPLELLAQLEEDNPLLEEDPAKLASYYFPPFMHPPVVPNLEPMAPSDPDIWHHMHNTRCLFKVPEYFPTPPEREGSGEGVEEAQPLLPRVPEDPQERAFWEITDVIPRPKKEKHRRKGSHLKGDESTSMDNAVSRKEHA